MRKKKQINRVILHFFENFFFYTITEIFQKEVKFCTGWWGKTKRRCAGKRSILRVERGGGGVRLKLRVRKNVLCRRHVLLILQLTATFSALSHQHVSDTVKTHLRVKINKFQAGKVLNIWAEIFNFLKKYAFTWKHNYFSPQRF